MRPNLIDQQLCYITDTLVARQHGSSPKRQEGGSEDDGSTKQNPITRPFQVKEFGLLRFGVSRSAASWEAVPYSAYLR